MLFRSVRGLTLSWFVPSLPAVALVLETVSNQVEIYRDRSRLLSVVNIGLSSLVDLAIVVEIARTVQDGIFYTRSLGSRVPDIVYRIFRKSDEDDFQALTDA